ncbi:MAG: DUF29 domain-containing protein [Crocosphaera sp.]|jgi:hypothetical protein
MTTKLSKTSEFIESTLYEKDYYLWLENTVNLLREENLTKLDIPHLIEEIEDMGRSEKRSLYSNLKILLMHLLKYRYQPEKPSNSWRYTIEEHRQRIAQALSDSPSLNNYLLEIFEKCYQDAKKLAAKETGLAIDAFPKKSPFTTNETLDSDYLPT